MDASGSPYCANIVMITPPCVMITAEGTPVFISASTIFSNA